MANEPGSPPAALRIVLARVGDQEWRPFRQAQWMAEVRRRPGLAAAPKFWFDVDEDAYRACLAGWEAVASDAAAARARLAAAGAREVGP